MKSDLNLTDYRSYRVPYIEEFVPGYEYHYVQVSTTQTTSKFANDIICLENGLFGKILYYNEKFDWVDIIFFMNGKEVLTKCYPTCWLKDKLTGKPWKPRYCKVITNSYCKGIWGTAWGIQNKEHLEELIKRKEVYVEGRVKYIHKNEDILIYYKRYPNIFGKLKPDIRTFTRKYFLWYNYINTKYPYAEFATQRKFNSKKDMFNFIKRSKTLRKAVYYTYMVNGKFYEKKLLNLEAQPMKRKNQLRSPERIAKKERQIYDNYKRNRKKNKKTKSQLFYQEHQSKKLGVVGTYDYAFHYTDENGDVKVKPVFGTRTRNYKHALKHTKISKKDLVKVVRTENKSWGADTDYSFIKKDKKDKVKSKKTDWQPHIPTSKLICIKNNITEEVKRVRVNEIGEKYDPQVWKFVSKTGWKNYRDKNKVHNKVVRKHIKINPAKTLSPKTEEATVKFKEGTKKNPILMEQEVERVTKKTKVKHTRSTCRRVQFYDKYGNKHSKWVPKTVNVFNNPIKYEEIDGKLELIKTKVEAPNNGRTLAKKKAKNAKILDKQKALHTKLNEQEQARSKLVPKKTEKDKSEKRLTDLGKTAEQIKRSTELREKRNERKSPLRVVKSAKTSKPNQEYRDKVRKKWEENRKNYRKYLVKRKFFELRSYYKYKKNTKLKNSA